MNYWVFDLDGTMVDSFQPYFNFLEEYLEEKLDQKLKEKYLSMQPLHILTARMDEARALQAMQILVERNLNELADIKVYTGIHTAIKHLRARGRGVAVWTSRDAVTAKAILDYTGLGKEIDLLVAGDHVEKRKPHTEGMLKIKEFYKCEMHELVMIGDHDIDMKPAKELGIKAVRASWHDHWSHEACTLADHQFYKHDDFHNWVSSLS